jgi:hypothetical protein
MPAFLENNLGWMGTCIRTHFLQNPLVGIKRSRDFRIVICKINFLHFTFLLFKFNLGTLTFFDYFVRTLNVLFFS